MDKKTVSYVVNGRGYTFNKLYMDGGILRGYCSRLRTWGSLFDTYIHLDSGPVLLAQKVG